MAVIVCLCSWEQDNRGSIKEAVEQFNSAMAAYFPGVLNCEERFIGVFVCVCVCVCLCVCECAHSGRPLRDDSYQVPLVATTLWTS